MPTGPFMNYLHYDLHLDPGEIVEVTLDKQANVRLLDEANFSNYKRGMRHTYSSHLLWWPRKGISSPNHCAARWPLASRN